MIWLTLLPFPLWDVYGWAAPGLQARTDARTMAALCACHCLHSVAAQALISFLLIGVENIGIQIEEPFAILPLAAYCTAIQRDVREVVARGEGAAPRRHTPGTLTRNL
jgi:putative membrane protein